MEDQMDLLFNKIKEKMSQQLELLGPVTAISGQALSFPRWSGRNMSTKQTITWISRDKIDRRLHKLGATLPASDYSSLFVRKYLIPHLR